MQNETSGKRFCLQCDDGTLLEHDLAYDVLLHTGIRIQPLPIWEEEWKHPETYSNPRLLVNIEREGIRL